MPTISNANLPAPKWYRKLQRIVNLATGPSTMAFIQAFHPKPGVILILAQLIAFIPTGMEIVSIIATNGEEYAPAGTTQNLVDTKAQLADATAAKIN